MSRADRLFEAFKGAFKEAKGVSDADKDKLISDLERAYQNEPPPTIAIIGETGMGKTSTLNSLFNAGARVGHSTPTTKSSEVFQLQIFDHQGNKGTIRVIDLLIFLALVNHPRGRMKSLIYIVATFLTLM